ncbi:MAG: hypothetical protein DRJ98_03240 [Thermoprotei archaeon]|nr:MAG: hypothetical protein DRJ98_03240 [Thermoprotei archaeon]RLF18902.1 MAG: hypothetical protein DRN06_00155 [Thermoprotei archaeon]
MSKISIRRLVLDTLKPREAPLIELSKALCEVAGIEEVDTVVIEVDARTETVKITIRGPDINYDEAAKIINDHGAVIRSVDEVNVYKLTKSK